MYKGQVILTHGVYQRVLKVQREDGTEVEPFDDMPPGKYTVIVGALNVSTDLDAELEDS